MATRLISTEISIKNEAEFRRQISAVNNSLKSMRSEMKLLDAQYEGQTDSTEYLTKKQKLLKEQYDQQEEKVRALSAMLESARSAYDENSSVVTRYKTQLDNATIELLKMKREVKEVSDAMESASKATISADKQIAVFDETLRDAGESADDTAGSVSNFGDATKDLGDNADQGADGLGGFAKALSQLQDAAKRGDIGGVVSALSSMKGLLAGAAIVKGLQEVAGAITDIVESTYEFRQITGTLQTSAEEAGYAWEYTSGLYREAFSVFGDDQISATVVANLQAMKMSTQELDFMLKLAEGAWETYGDSIPVDSLAESINETANAGKVTGTFADVLNWAKISEDEFNEELAKIPDSASRANLMMMTMANSGLADTADAWKENNKDIVEYNQKQLELKEATAQLGEALSPVAGLFTDLKITGVEALTSIIDAATGVVEKIREMKQEYNEWRSNIPVIGSVYDKLVTNYRSSSDYKPGIWDRLFYGPDGSHAGGLDYVPYDGYIAELHQGEAVLTSGEANFLRDAMASSRVLGSGRRSAGAAATGSGSSVGTAPKVYDLTIPVELTIDGATFARKEYKYRIAEDNRRGTPLSGKGVR